MLLLGVCRYSPSGSEVLDVAAVVAGYQREVQSLKAQLAALTGVCAACDSAAMLDFAGCMKWEVQMPCCITAQSACSSHCSHQVLVQGRSHSTR